MDAFRAALQELRALAPDRCSGAAELTDRAAAALIRFLRSGPCTAEQLATLAEATLRAQPSMAPLLNLGYLLECAAQESRLPGRRAFGLSRPQLIRALERFRRDCRRAHRQIASRFAHELRRGAIVLTYSYSSTVLAALLAARGKLARVICSESRPQLEGRWLAEKLARAGIPVVLVADAALPERVGEADAVVVGADAILARPGPKLQEFGLRPAPRFSAGASARGSLVAYVNKIGTCILQEEARAARTPFYVLADTSKILRANVAPLYRIAARPASEVWARAPRGVQIENRYFERVPLRRGVTLLTERGSLPHALLSRLAARGL